MDKFVINFSSLNFFFLDDGQIEDFFALVKEAICRRICLRLREFPNIVSLGSYHTSQDCGQQAESEVDALEVNLVVLHLSKYVSVH